MSLPVSPSGLCPSTSAHRAAWVLTSFSVPADRLGSPLSYSGTSPEWQPPLCRWLVLSVTGEERGQAPGTRLRVSAAAVSGLLLGRHRSPGLPPPPHGPGLSDMPGTWGGSCPRWGRGSPRPSWWPRCPPARQHPGTARPRAASWAQGSPWGVTDVLPWDKTISLHVCTPPPPSPLLGPSGDRSLPSARFY